MNFQHLQELMYGVWLVNDETGETLPPALHMMLAGNPVEFHRQPFVATLYNPSGSVQFDKNDKITPEKGAVVSIPIKGMLSKYDEFFGDAGTTTLSNIIKMADNDPNVAAIVLDIDTPGGVADGAMNLANTVAETKKPVTAFINGQAASAGYWIASAANKIIAEPKSMVGSVGAMTSFADFQPALEKMGVKFHRIVSDLTPDKNALYDKVRAGDYDQYKTDILNPLASSFVEGVKKYRPHATPDQLTGKMYYSENVTGSMVDETGSYDHALVSASSATAAAPQSSNLNLITNMTNFEHLNKALGVESIEMTQEGAYLNASQLEAVNAALAPAQTSEPAAQTEPTTPEPATPQAAELNPDVIAHLAEQLASVQAELEAMRETPGAKTAAVKPATDPEKTSDKPKLATDINKSFWENVQAVASTY